MSNWLTVIVLEFLSPVGDRKPHPHAGMKKKSVIFSRIRFCGKRGDVEKNCLALKKNVLTRDFTRTSLYK